MTTISAKDATQCCTALLSGHALRTHPGLALCWGPVHTECCAPLGCLHVVRGTVSSDALTIPPHLHCFAFAPPNQKQQGVRG